MESIIIKRKHYIQLSQETEHKLKLSFRDNRLKISIFSKKQFFGRLKTGFYNPISMWYYSSYCENLISGEK